MNRMGRKWGGLLLALVLFASALPVRAEAAETYTLASRGAIVMDADTGEVLYKKNATKPMYPASITKVLTGLLVMEHCDSSETVTVSASASSAKIPRGFSHVSLSQGDSITVKDAMCAMMLPSANDAANALAEHVSGSQSKFAALMNKRAKELGATSSNFVNANGISNNKHYTTAYDMALITRAASKNKSFMQYFGATSYTFPKIKNAKAKKITGYQYMMIDGRDEYDPSVIGGKIGYTGQAGHTMVTVAERDGRRLIVVVLGSTRSGKYDDTAKLLDYGFSKSSSGSSASLGEMQEIWERRSQNDEIDK